MGKKFGTYSQEAVEAALHAIRNKNCPVRIAADTHGVPRETLRRRLKGLPTRAESKRDMLKVPPHLEHRLLAWLRAQSALGTHISHATFTAIVLALLKSEMDTENVYIGQTWFGRFLKRHGCAGLVSFRAFRSDLIRDKFSERENVVWTMELLLKLGFCSALWQPSQSLSQKQRQTEGQESQQDWTIETFPKPENVWCLTEIAFGRTGEVLVGGDQCRERGASIGSVWLRALECVSANGVALNPTLIRAQLPQQQQQQQQADARESSDNNNSSDSTAAAANWSQDTVMLQRHGWQYTRDDLRSPALSQQTALNWLTHTFIPMACSRRAPSSSNARDDHGDLKFLLVYGIHDVFLSAPIQQLCGIHNLHIVYLPAHTSECFQLCDLFAPLCVALSPPTTVDNAATAVTNATDLADTVSLEMEERVLHVYAQFRSAVLHQNPDAVRDAWRKSGIVPFNPSTVLFSNEFASFAAAASVNTNGSGDAATAAAAAAISGVGGEDLSQQNTVEQLPLPKLPDQDGADESLSAENLMPVPKTANELYKTVTDIQADVSLSDALKRRRIMYMYKKLFAKMDMLEQKATSLEKENEMLKPDSQHRRSPTL